MSALMANMVIRENFQQKRDQIDTHALELDFDLSGFAIFANMFSLIDSP